METHLKESGTMTRQMVTESTRTPTEQNTKVTGRMTSNTGMAKKYGQMAHDTKEITLKAKSMDEGFMSGLMEALTMENG